MTAHSPWITDRLPQKEDLRYVLSTTDKDRYEGKFLVSTEAGTVTIGIFSKYYEKALKQWSKGHWCGVYGAHTAICAWMALPPPYRKPHDIG